MEDLFYPIYLELPPENIVNLKFLLESYEGIGELRTLDKDIAQVVILSLQDSKQDVLNLLESEKDAIKARIIDKPASLSGDWLFGELS